MIEVHERLRDGLAALREEIDAGGQAGDLLRQDLGIHCIAFCSVVTRHHTAEDEVAFPRLAAQYPSLATVLDELAHDHQLIAGILRSLRQAVESREGSTAAQVGREVDGLSAVLESHFVWEERRLVQALDGLRLQGTGQNARDLLGLSPDTDFPDPDPDADPALPTRPDPGPA